MSAPDSNRAKLLWLAYGQHGIVSTRQLLALGVSRRQVEHWSRTCLLLRVFRGVYVLGRPLDSYSAAWMAATLRGGKGAVLAGRSAAAAWGFMDDSTGIQVMRGKGRNTKERGADLHRRFYLEVRSGSLRQEDFTTIGQIPVMTPARALMDIAGDLTPRLLRRAFVNAGRQGLLTGPCLEQCASRGASFKGHARLMDLASLWQPGTGKLRSPLESEFLLLCGKFGIPAPRTNFRIGGFEADCFWPGTPIVVEPDSRTYHDDGFGFEDDRDKGNALAEQGYTVLRFTYRKVHGSPAEVARTLRHHLGLSA